MSNQNKFYLNNVKLFAAILVFFGLNGCAKQALIPISTPDTIKYYERIAVHAGGGCSKTDFSINHGDYILILAYGRVFTPGSWHPGGPPHASLFMKIGKRGEPRFAVTPPDNRRFFRSTESGRLAFCIENPYMKPGFSNLSGGFTVDIFVFLNLNEQRILQALDIIAKANPTDKRLGAQLQQIIGQKLFSQPLVAAPENKTIEIENATPINVGISGPKAKESPIIEDKKRQFRTIFQAGHTALVRSAAFSPSGKHIISGGDDRTLRLWEVSTGREIRVFKGHLDAISSVAFCPLGRFVLSGSDDKTLRLWEVSTGKEIRSFVGHEDAINSVAYSPDGKHVISGSDDKTLRLWEVSTGKGVRISEGYESPVNSVSFSPDGKHVLSGDWDGTIQLREVATGKRIGVFKGHKSCINSVAFSPDSKFVLSGSDDGTLQLWKTSTRKKLRTFKGHKYFVTCVAFSPDGKYALSGSHDNTFRLWEVDTGMEVKLFKGHKESIRSITFSPNGRYALSSSNDRSLRLWELSTGREIKAFEGHNRSIRSVVCSPDGKFALWGGDDKTLRLWEVNTGKEIRSFVGHEGAINSVAYSPDGKYVISGSDDKTLRLWEVSTGKEIRSFVGHEDAINSVAYSPDGKHVISGSDNATLRLWDIFSGKQIKVFEVHMDIIGSVAFSPDGRFILSASNQRFRMWEVTGGREVKFMGGIFNDLLATTTTVAISPDGKFILSGTADNNILLWKVSPDSGTRLFQRFLRGHKASVNALAFSPDSKYALSGSDDKTLRLWEMSSDSAIKVLVGHTDSVNSVTFSSDGKFILSAGDDCSSRIWDLELGQEIVSFHYSKDGEWILTSPDGYYTCSPEGNKLLYWVYPDGMETFSFEQFESLFKRPDIIKARLSGDLNAGKPVPIMTKPPHIDMEDHLTFKEILDRTYSLNLIAFAQKEVKKVRVFVNGKPAMEIPIKSEKKELSLEVPLFSGANRITAVAYDEKGFSSNPKFFDVISKHAGLAKPNLYVLASGISNYPRLSSRWQLEYAHTDAQALVKAFKSQEGKLFKEVRYNILTNEKATIDTITDGLNALSTINENDVAVIFLAGHGIRSKDGTFYFLTSEGSFNEPQVGGLNWSVLGEYLSKIKGRVILFLDACHSGSIVTETVVPNDELAQQFFTGKRSGVMIFSASKGRQYSMESPDIGSGFGIFTYTLLQGLGPKAKEVDFNGDNVVEFMELVDYVSDYVDKATKGEQTPWLSRKEMFGDFPIAMVK